MDRAKVLVFGATGYTGKLVCASLEKKKIPFAIAGRSKEKLDALSRTHGGAESCVVDIEDAKSVRDAIEGRAIVCACAGPFVQVGEPALRACAELGVHYADTTGEQSFAVMAFAKYHETAEKSGSCVVPGMAFEIAVSDWTATIAAERSGGVPDEIAILYANDVKGGMAVGTSKGTKLSALGMMQEREPLQWVNGRTTRELAGSMLRSFKMKNGRTLTAHSFPSLEAVVTGRHTGAGTVRTFMAMGTAAAWAFHLTYPLVPFFARAASGIAAKRISGGASEGPGDSDRAGSRFEVVAEARRGTDRTIVRAIGGDMYGLTGEIQAYAAACAITGEVKARGVVSPSAGYPPARAFEALADAGLSLA